MNSIPQDQLTERQLDRLAAQRQLYSDAKKIQAVQMTLSVPAAIVWSVLIVFLPELKPGAAAWGVAVTLIDQFLLTPWQRSIRDKAAKVQELFDCDVLQLEWRELKVGRRPDAEAIMESSSKFKCKDPECSTLRDWYPPGVGVLPMHLARLVCQRCNCWWDAKLRRRYAAYMVGLAVALTALVFTLGLVGGLTVSKFFLAVLAPLMPVYTLVMRQYGEHKQSAAALDRLKEHAEKLWDRALAGSLTPEALAVESRSLQDEIYERRRSSPLIFDWVYRRLRDSQEEQMNKGAGELVEQARTSLHGMGLVGLNVGTSKDRGDV